MADTYSKLLGLSESSTPPTETKPAAPVHSPTAQEKKSDLPVKTRVRTGGKKQRAQRRGEHSGNVISPSAAPMQELHKQTDTSFLTTKEKTKYGTYLTDESIEKIRIRAIQTKRDDHQILQEAVNQYFDRLK